MPPGPERGKILIALSVGKLGGAGAAFKLSIAMFVAGGGTAETGVTPLICSVVGGVFAGVGVALTYDAWQDYNQGWEEIGN